MKVTSDCLKMYSICVLQRALIKAALCESHSNPPVIQKFRMSAISLREGFKYIHANLVSHSNTMWQFILLFIINKCVLCFLSRVSRNSFLAADTVNEFN